MDSERHSPTDEWIQFIRENIAWWLFGAILLVVVIQLLQRFIAWIVLGLFFYYVARPISRHLEQLGGRPSLAAASTLLLIVVPFVLLFAVVVVVAATRLDALLTPNITPASLQSLLNVFPIANLPDLEEQLGHQVSVEYVLQTGVTVARSAAKTGVYLLLTVLFTFILLISDRRLSQWVQTDLLNNNSKAVSYLTTVDRGVRSIYFSYALTIFVIIILTAILYPALNFIAPVGVQIPFPILLAVLTGIFSLVPGVGRPLFFIIVTAYLAVRAVSLDPTRLWFPLVFLVLMVGVFGNVVRIYIRPALSGHQFPHSLVMFAFVLGPPLFGWYGIFLGPLVLAFLFPFLTLVLPGMLYPDRSPDANTTVGASDEQP